MEIIIRAGAERVDPARKLTRRAEIADQDVAAETALLLGGSHYTPRRVERAARSEAPHEDPVRGEDIDEAEARSRDHVIPLGVLLGVGYEQIVVDVGNAERREAGRNVRIAKVSVELCRRELGVVGLDGASREIGREQEIA